MSHAVGINGKNKKRSLKKGICHTSYVLRLTSKK